MKKDVFAIYFPSWHPDRHYGQWYGKGFSEWELLKTTKPLFPGHIQPRKPLWGYFDESDTQMMEKQIDLAADSGITGFLFDWYWYSGEQFLEKPLDSAFLGAKNRNRLKFSIMWANHDWGVWPALADLEHAGMNGSENQSSKIFLNAFHSPEDLEKVINFCSEKYFSCENYWKIDGKPVFSIYSTPKLFQFIKPQDALEIMNRTAQKNGFSGIYTLMNVGCCNDNAYFCGFDRVPELCKYGFDATFAYNSGVPGFMYDKIPQEMPVYDYSIMTDAQRYCWQQLEKHGLPVFRSVTLGSDVAPRWSRQIKLPMDYQKLGYCPICIENTPEKFGKLFEEAYMSDTKAVIINAWNEWSEGMFLIPDEKYKGGYLDEIARITSQRRA